jgi:hypothetical protein
MWRFLLLMFGAAALGSLAGTLAFAVIAGGSGTPEPARAIIGLTAATMFFTVPGTLMLIGLQAILAGRGWGRHRCDALVALFGAAAGAVILAFIAPHAAGIGPSMASPPRLLSCASSAS